MRRWHSLNVESWYRLAVDKHLQIGIVVVDFHDVRRLEYRSKLRFKKLCIFSADTKNGHRTDVAKYRILYARLELSDELVGDQRGDGTWYGVSRFPGPGWVMVTVHSNEVVERRARQVAARAQSVG